MSARRRDYSLYRSRSRSRSRRRAAWVIGFLALLFVMYTALTGFLVRSYRIGSVSMEPAFSIGDRVLSTPLAFGARIPFTTERLAPVRSPKRGDVVVVEPSYAAVSPIVAVVQPFVSFFTFERVRLAQDPSTQWDDELLVKRVIGLPGDTVRIEEFTAHIMPAGGQVFVSEAVLIETEYMIGYSPLPAGWDPSILPFSGTQRGVLLGPDEYYLLGDNRSASSDSRHWGPVPLSSMRALVLTRYWPLGRAAGP